MGDYNDGFGMKFPKLTAERYHSWKFNMMMYLKGTDLWDIVEGVEIVREGSKPWEHEGRQGEGIDMAQIGTNWKRKHGDKLVPSEYGFGRLGPMIAAMSDLLAVDIVSARISSRRVLVRLRGT